MASLERDASACEEQALPAPLAGAAELLGATDCRTPAFFAQWSALAACASEPNPFCEPWFVCPSLDAFDPSGEVRLFAYREGGTLCGLLPLRHGARYYGRRIPVASGWLHENAFCGSPLIAPGCEARFWTALLGLLDRSPRGSLFFHLAALPQDGAAWLALRDVLQTQRRPAGIVQSHARAMLSSPHGARDYMAQSLSAKKRKELRRQHNRLAELGALEFERQEGSANLAAWVEDYCVLEQAGWKGRAGSAFAASAPARGFLHCALAGAALAGRLERLALRLDGRPIAMLANFLAPPGAFSFKTVYDEEYSRFSPGVLLQQENLALLDRPDIAWCDSCAAADHPMIERIWRERRQMLSVNIAVGGPVRRGLARLAMRLERAKALPEERP